MVFVLPIQAIYIVGMSLPYEFCDLTRRQGLSFTGVVA